MSERYLQPLRTLIQAAFILYCLVLAVHFYSFIVNLNSGVAALDRPDSIDAFQPVSALFTLVAWLRGLTINPYCPAALLILLSALLVSFLLRRSFCSWICPVGTLSEWLWKLGFSYRYRNAKVPAPLDRRLKLLKYIFFILLVIQAFSWSVPFLEQYLGASGRAASDIRFFSFFRHPSLAMIPLLFLVFLSVRLRNPFCRYLCPYGALLSIATLISPVAVQRNKNRCVLCGVCSTVCPSGIDVAKADRVNDPECTGCGRCVSHCRVHSALRMTLFRRIAIPGILYALMILLVFLGTIHLGKIAGVWKSRLNIVDYINSMIDLFFA